VPVPRPFHIRGACPFGRAILLGLAHAPFSFPPLSYRPRFSDSSHNMLGRPPHVFCNAKPFALGLFCHTAFRFLLFCVGGLGFPLPFDRFSPYWRFFPFSPCFEFDHWEPLLPPVAAPDFIGAVALLLAADPAPRPRRPVFCRPQTIPTKLILFVCFSFVLSCVIPQI